MATPLMHALQLFVQELQLSQALQAEAAGYAAQVAALVNAKYGTAQPASVADAVRAILPEISQLQPATTSAESTGLLQTFLQRLAAEVGDGTSTVFERMQTAPDVVMGAPEHRYPSKYKRDTPADDELSSDSLAHSKRARTGAEAPTVGSSGSLLHGSDAYASSDVGHDGTSSRASRGIPSSSTASSGGSGAGGSAGLTENASGDSPYLQFRIVKNDGSRRNLIWLTQVKNIFAAQLPKMPREYIARLVFDRKHRSMLVIKKDKVVGGICFRPFLPQRFAEIAFCAITASEQVKGYGTRLMNHTKEAVKMDGITHFLTYADNYAIGYFKKQGFTKQISMTPERWVGYIKDYDGGTLMECIILPQVNYLAIPAMVAAQKARVASAVQAVSSARVVYPSLHTPEGMAAVEEARRKLLKQGGTAEGAEDAPVTAAELRPESLLAQVELIPGTEKGGWRQAHVHLRAERGPVHAMLGHHKSGPGGGVNTLLRQSLMNLTASVASDDQCMDSWPFREPVQAQLDPISYADYLETLKKSAAAAASTGSPASATPLDLQLIAPKASENVYRSLDHWLWEMQAMTNNCRSYNRPDSEYVACATRVDAFVAARVKQPHLWLPGWTPAQTQADETGALVIDVGAYNARFGYAGEDMPKVVFNTATGVTQDVSDAAGTGASGATRKRYHVGQAARIPTGGMEVRNPYDVGLIEDADMLGAIWSHGVSQLRVDSREHPLIIVEPAHSLPLHREEMLRMAFDTLGAPAVYLAKAPVMQAFALGRASALVIDIGASGSRTVGVYDGHILKQGQVISEVGGNVISSALLEMLQRTGVMAPQTELLPRALLTKKQRRVPVDGMQVDGEGVGSSSASGATKLVWDVQKRMDLISPAPGTGRRPVTRSFRDVWVLHDVLDDIKHCCASVTDVGFGEEGAKPPLKEHKYELPDGTLLRVKDPLQVCPELHFRPGQYYMQFQHTLTRAQTGNAWHTLYGVDLIQRERPRQDHAPSIQAMMLASLSTCPAEVRKDLSHHIVLTGGGSLLEGLPERLKWEVMALIPQAFKPRILPASPSERQYGSWIGASILASLGTFQQMWISKAEYEEQGAAWALENRCF